MGTLYKVGGCCCHVVAQIVETKLIVCSECDVCLICLAACLGVGLVLVDAVYRETVEHIERSHPLGVTLCQIVVDGHHVNTVACEGVEEYRQCGNKSLTLTGCHLGNLSLMKHAASEELHIVVNHFPLQVIASGCPVIVVESLVSVDCHKVVLWVCCQLTVEVVGCHHSVFVGGKTLGCLLHDGVNLGHSLVECHLVKFQCLLVELVYLCKDGGALVNGGVLDGGFQLGYLCLLFVGSGLDVSPYFLNTCTECVVVQYLNQWSFCLSLFHQRLDEFQVSRRFVAKQ